MSTRDVVEGLHRIATGTPAEIAALYAERVDRAVGLAVKRAFDAAS